MIDLDFLEIGTSNFDTLIEKATNETVGISIEPLSFYLDQLPNPANVKKINCAVSLNNIESAVTFFYISEDKIKMYNLPEWLKGCNSLGDYHPQHKELNIEHLVDTTTVNQIPISKILKTNRVRKIKYLKIDTEGGDCNILIHLKHYLNDKDKIYYPKVIVFETNQLTSYTEIDNVLKLYTQLGYRKSTKAGKGNTKLVLI